MSRQPDLMLTEIEAANLLRLSSRTLQRLRLEGGGPEFVRLTERRIGYTRTALEAWIVARLATSTSDRGGRAA